MTVWAPSLRDMLLVSGLMDVVGAFDLIARDGCYGVGCLVLLFASCRVIATEVGCVYVVVVSFVVEIVTVCVCVCLGSVSLPKGLRVVLVCLFSIVFVFAWFTSRSDPLWMKIV